jgi:hypothetical protein
MTRRVVATQEVVKSKTADIASSPDDDAGTMTSIMRRDPKHPIGARLREVAVYLGIESWREYARLCKLDSDTQMLKIADTGNAETKTWLKIVEATGANLDYIIRGVGPVGERSFTERVHTRIKRESDRAERATKIVTDRPSGPHRATSNYPRK